MEARVHNITFHGVGEPPRALAPSEAHVWLSEERFLAVLDALARRDDVRISFDDGNRSDVDVALPALLERGLGATFFVLAGRLGEPGHLGRDDVAALAGAGMTIGSHGLHHRNWRTLARPELTAELAESRSVLEDAAGMPVTRTSVPFGAYDRRVLGELRRDAGYEHVFTSDGGRAREDAWLQPRTSVTTGDEPATLAVADRRVAAAQRGLKGLVKRWR